MTSFAAFMMVWHLLVFNPQLFPFPGNPPQASYTGPGDITAGAVAWYGLRAYSRATRGTRAANVCIPADAACADLSTDATTGDLVITTIGGSSCASVTCTVKILYDQTVGGACTGGSCDAVASGTISQRAVLTTSCVGSLPCMTWTASSLQMNSALSADTVNQPHTWSAIGKRTGSFTTFAPLVGIISALSSLGFKDSADTAYVSAGAALTGTATDNTIHALQGMLNGASSKLMVDGSTTTGAGGSNVVGTNLCFGQCAAIPLTGISFEGGLWAGDQSANFTAMNSNQHTYWGF